MNQMIKIVIVNHSKGAACNSETDLWSDVLATFDSEARRLGYLYGVTYLNDDIAQIEAVITECNMDFVAGVLLFGTELKEEDQNLLERIKNHWFFMTVNFQIVGIAAYVQTIDKC